MGWTTCTRWQKKSDVLEAIRTEELSSWEILQMKSTKAGAAVVARKEGLTTAFIFLIDGKDKARYGYGIKGMDEGMGPYEVEGFPVEWLDLLSPAEQVGSHAADFRERVRKAAQGAITAKAKTANMKAGTVIALPDSFTIGGRPIGPITLTERVGKGGTWYGALQNGSRTKLSPKLLAAATIVKE